MFYGVRKASVRGSWLSGADSLAGTSDGGLAPRSSPVLGGHRGGSDDRGRSGGGRRVVTGRVPLVPAGWRCESTFARDCFGARYLSSDERESIALWRAQGAGVREIARRLKRVPSTISRELRRNASTRTYRVDYRASVAQWHAERRARRPKTSKLVTNDRLRQYVQDKLSGVVRGAVRPGRRWPRQRAVEGPQ